MKEPTKKISAGVVLRVAQSGVLQETIQDTLDLVFKEIEKHQSFYAYLKESSREKGSQFIESIIRNGAAYDWELHVGKDDDAALFNFSGFKIEQDIMLIGSPLPKNIEQIADGFMEMNNEQINKLRLFMKKDQTREVKKNELLLYNDMSELNNELTNTQRKLMKKTAELERTNKLKNQILGMAAHDLRNPLMVIQNFAYFLIDDHKEQSVFSDKQYMMVKEIKDTSKYMVRIIEDILDLSSFESGSISIDTKPVNLVQLIQEAVVLCQPAARKKDITINAQLPETSVSKVIDGRKFRQVLDNLISNAIKYSNRSTEIEVGIKAINETGRVPVFVKDQGQGIPEDELDDLFKPFSKTSVESTAEEKSTGLGLAIVKKIVDAHGGEIHIESEVGVGSTFTVFLP